MNHGIADATELVKELNDAMAGLKSIKEAADDYQTEMISRAGDEVLLSVINTEMLHDWSRFRQSAIMQKGGDLIKK
jgi:2-polyprenyl-6-methoxyphenol hydroxylase-like FAD-dependent oxidoreductase